MVKRSNSIMKRILMMILQIMMILKGLKVGLLMLYVGESNVKMTRIKERDLF